MFNSFGRTLFAFLLVFYFSTKTYSQVSEETGDLFVRISNIISAMPGHSGDEYADPEVDDLINWGICLNHLLNGDYTLADASAGTIGYDVIEFLDTSGEENKTYYILESVSTNYWGTYVYNPDYCRPLVIQSPHTLKEHNTGKEGIHVFIETEALFFCLNGTSRCNSSSFSDCDGTTSICSSSSENYRISDLPHNPASIFQATTKTLFNDFSNTYFLQIHGFTKLSNDPYLILSNGTQITPDPDFVVPLSNNLYNEDNILSFKIAHIDLDWTRLRGFTNTQGRFVNSSVDACYADATTASGRFIHIEQEKTRLRDDVTGWDKLANALKNTFTSYGNFWDGAADNDWSTAANWRRNMVPDASDNISITNKGNDLFINQGVNNPAQCAHLEIQDGASIIINEGMGFTVNGRLMNAGTLTVKSNAQINGSLIVMGKIWGITNIERYIESWADPLHGWHFLASPVQAQAINDFHTVGSGNDFYKWNEIYNIWVNRTANGGNLNGDFETDFKVGCGYLMANTFGSLKTFSGVLFNIDFDTTGLTKTSTSGHGGWHLLGNPFSSSLIWNKTNWALTNIDATAKIWVESNASYLDITSGTGVIPAMQGFMVHVNSTPGSLTIDAADRSHHGINWFKNDDPEQLKLVVFDMEGRTRQQCVIQINENATTGFDTEFDSRFLAGYAPQFYSIIDDGKLSTNTISELTCDTEIHLGFIKNSSSEFSISAEGLDKLQSDSVFLTDLKLKHSQLLNENPQYSFCSQDGDSPNRFLIHFRSLDLGTLQQSIPIEVFSVGNEIHVTSEDIMSAELNFYDVSGRLIKKVRIDNNNNVAVNMGNYKGVVLVSITTRDAHFTEKVLVW